MVKLIRFVNIQAQRCWTLYCTDNRRPPGNMGQETWTVRSQHVMYL